MTKPEIMLSNKTAYLHISRKTTDGSFLALCFSVDDRYYFFELSDKHDEGSTTKVKFRTMKEICVAFFHLMFFLCVTDIYVDNHEGAEKVKTFFINLHKKCNQPTWAWSEGMFKIHGIDVQAPRYKSVVFGDQFAADNFIAPVEALRAAHMS